MNNFRFSAAITTLLFAAPALSQEVEAELYYTGNDYRFPLNPDRPECRWIIEDQTIGELLRNRSDSRYFVRGLDAVDLASTTIDDPNANLTVIVSRDSYWNPGTYFDILDLLDDRDRLFQILARHISLSPLSATVSRGGQSRQELLTLGGTVWNFTTTISNALRQSYYMNGSFFDYEGGVCMSNGILFFKHAQVFEEILFGQ